MASPQTLISHGLDATTADHCVIVFNVSSTANLRWANNTLTTNGVMSGARVTVVSVVDGSQGSAAGVLTRTTTSVSQIEALVGAADAAARLAGAAEDAAPLVAGAASPDFDIEPGHTSIDAFGTFSRDLGEAFSQARSGNRLLYGYVEHDVTTTYVASTTGLRLRYEQPTGHVGMTGKTADFSTSAWVGQAVEQMDQIDASALAGELNRRIDWGRRRIDLPAGRHEAILSPTAVADLAIYAYFVSSGRDAHEGQTVFSAPDGGTKVGQKIADRSVRLHSDPYQPGMSACPFVAVTSSDSSQSVFDNGLSLTATDWITGGSLRSLGTSRHTAAVTGLAETPHVDNLMLTIDGGKGSVDDLVASSERSLLVTCLWYIREVDPHTLLLTGLTRDGVYLVEGGEVVGAVNNFRFNESPLDLLNRFTEAGRPVRSFSREWGDYFPRTSTPPLRVPDFNMSTVSQAS